MTQALERLALLQRMSRCRRVTPPLTMKSSTGAFCEELMLAVGPLKSAFCGIPPPTPSQVKKDVPPPLPVGTFCIFQVAQPEPKVRLAACRMVTCEVGVALGTAGQVLITKPAANGGM